MVLFGDARLVKIMDLAQLESPLVGTLVALASSLQLVETLAAEEYEMVVGVMEAQGNHREIIKTQGHFNQCS